MFLKILILDVHRQKNFGNLKGSTPKEQYDYYEKNTKFYTSKKEKDEHGWGIESVKQIVRKYNGEIDFKYDKDFFEVEIIISDNT